MLYFFFGKAKNAAINGVGHGGSACGFGKLTRFNVETENQLLVPQVKLAVGDDWVSPDLTAFLAQQGLRSKDESPHFLPSFRRGLDQDHGSITFGLADKTIIRVSDGPFPQRFFFIPNQFPRLEVLAYPTVSIGIAVEVISKFDYATMMVFHDFEGILRFPGVYPV